MRLTYILKLSMPNSDAAGIQTAQMCDAFSEIGHDVRVWDSYRRGGTNEESLCEFYGLDHPIPTRTLPYLDPYGLTSLVGTTLAKPVLVFANVSFAFVAALATIRDDSDVYITREWPVAVLFVLLGIPTVFSAHTVDAMGFSPRARKAFSYIGGRNALKLVVANSQGTAEGMVEIGLPREKVMGIPNGVDIAKYEPALDREAARKSTDLPPDERLVVYTGSLLESKGVYTLAEASADIDGTVVFVGGKPSTMTALEEFLDAEGLEDVRLVGRVEPDAVPQYQFAADVLVLPPLAESYETHHQPQYTSPLKLFEYMAARRPIVASDIPALRSVLTHEENALFVEPGSSEAFAVAVNRLATEPDLADRLAAAARGDVEEYTIQNRVRTISETLIKRL